MSLDKLRNIIAWWRVKVEHRDAKIRRLEREVDYHKSRAADFEHRLRRVVRSEIQPCITEPNLVQVTMTVDRQATEAAYNFDAVWKELLEQMKEQLTQFLKRNR